MGYYDEVYLKRLNRYGLNYQSRVQAQRERGFDEYLYKSIYRVDFEYNGEEHPGTLEQYQQDKTKTLMYLLTRVGLQMPNGTMLSIKDKFDDATDWMIFWLENLQASGYNKYVVLKMTHTITWRDCEKIEHTSRCYLWGPNSGAIKDTIKSKTASILYTEDFNSRFLIMPFNEALAKDTYFEIGEGATKEAYRVTGYDKQSTLGVEYVTIDPQYIRDNTPPPVPAEGDNPDEYYWLNGGNDNGST